jgi:hypothetical protein
MHQVHRKVSRVSLNVYPMWLIFTYTRPQERYGRISQYKKLIQSFPIIFFDVPSLVTRDTALKRPVTKLVLLPSISIVDFFLFLYQNCTEDLRCTFGYVKSGVHVRVSHGSTGRKKTLTTEVVHKVYLTGEFLV